MRLREFAVLSTCNRIEFYGAGLDTPATDKRIYWLVVGSEPGKRIALSKSDARAGGVIFEHPVSEL